MCGFLGFIGCPNKGFERRWMQAQPLQYHRGPDNQSEKRFLFKKHKLFLGFQRLSIIDLNSSANQPMVSEKDDTLIIFNGEIYNFIELKQELISTGCSFSTNSDTEVLFNALRYWGPEKACSKFNGMWAFAFFDLKTGDLFLSKDRFGKKPLYFYLSDEGLYFASEAKSLLTMIGKKFSLNYQVIGEFLFQSQINASNAYFLNDICQIPASTIIHFSFADKVRQKKSIQYWDFPNNESDEIISDNLIQTVREKFFNAVNIRLRSDVPVGILLSGGLDSSSIASAVNHLNNNEVLLFSAVDNYSQYDESPFIDTMANYLGANVKKLDLSLDKENIFNILEELIWFNDQPVPSLSNLSHHLLVKMARDSGIKVLMTGQGADELLCGYRKYLMFYVQYLIRNGKLRKAYEVISEFHNNNTIISQFNFSEAKRYLKYFSGKGIKDSKGDALKDVIQLNIGLEKGATIASRQLMDYKYFSLPQLLHTEDRMSMAVSTEMRVPFLDVEFVETVLPLSIECKLKNGWTKYIFRKSMEQYLPSTITWRKDKQNFGNAQGELLKGFLSEEIRNNYFSSDSLIFKKQIMKRNRLMKTFGKYINQPVNKGLVAYREIFAPISLEIWLRKFENYIV